jgi:hypothetical protein
MVKKISDIFDLAESVGTDKEKLKAYGSVKEIMSWMKVPLDDPNYND